MRRKEIEENKMKLQVLFRFFLKIYIHTFGLPMMDMNHGLLPCASRSFLT